jgi:bifunctional ADP-heptose synthase (sugar kinase/adenylyltransferase)
LSTKDTQKHTPIFEVAIDSNEKDKTGCVDQTMVALCAFVQQGKTLQQATELAVLAGTLQFHRTGVKPVKLNELPA